MEKGKKKQKGRGRGGNNSRRVGRIISSGGVVFKKLPDSYLWLVTATTPSIEYPKVVWRLPKGWLDDIENGTKPGILAKGERRATEDELQKNALKEIAEEGGIKAEIVKKIGTEKYFYTTANEGPVLKFVTFYLTRWLSDMPLGFGSETSEVKWLQYKDARKQLTHSGEKKILDKAKELLEAGI